MNWIWFLVSIICIGIIILGIIHIIIPLNRLWSAIKDIDFNNSVIDFTKVEALPVQGTSTIKGITLQFKSLQNILCNQIMEVNNVTDQSERDGLTNCYNKKHLDKVKSSYETAQNFIIIFIDVNNLKRMNDTFGHEAGDNLIINAAKKLSFWDKYGEVYRMGGDEFMVTLKNIPTQKAKALIDSWYPTVGVLNRTSDGFRCVLSYGVAEGRYGSSFDQIQKLADDRMYNMKVAIKKQFGEPMR